MGTFTIAPQVIIGPKTWAKVVSTPPSPITAMVVLVHPLITGGVAMPSQPPTARVVSTLSREGIAFQLLALKIALSVPFEASVVIRNNAYVTNYVRIASTLQISCKPRENTTQNHGKNNIISLQKYR